jgi:hypothetical protein
LVVMMVAVGCRPTTTAEGERGGQLVGLGEHRVRTRKRDGHPSARLLVKYLCRGVAMFC